MTEVRAAIKAVIVHEGKFLIMKHLLVDSSIWWDIVGGKVDHGEEPYDTLRREIKEEMDIEVEIGKILGIYWFYTTSDNTEIICTCFIAHPKSLTVDITKNPGRENIQEYQWVTKEQFLSDEYPSTPSLKDLIRSADL